MGVVVIRCDLIQTQFVYWQWRGWKGNGGVLRNNSKNFTYTLQMCSVFYDHFKSLRCARDIFDLLAHHFLLEKNIHEFGHFDARVNIVGLILIIRYQTSTEVLACFSYLLGYCAVDLTNSSVFLIHKIPVKNRIPNTDCILGWIDWLSKSSVALHRILLVYRDVIVERTFPLCFHVFLRDHNQSVVCNETTIWRQVIGPRRWVRNQALIKLLLHEVQDNLFVV